jgi:hypothetical protein
MRAQVLDQKVETEKLSEKQIQKSLKGKTTIILSKKNIAMISSLGARGETYDDIIERIIDFDIEIAKKSTGKS